MLGFCLEDAAGRLLAISTATALGVCAVRQLHPHTPRCSHKLAKRLKNSTKSECRIFTGTRSVCSSVTAGFFYRFSTISSFSVFSVTPYASSICLCNSSESLENTGVSMGFHHTKIHHIRKSLRHWGSRGREFKSRHSDQQNR